jgi:hypothetical protein
MVVHADAGRPTTTKILRALFLMLAPNVLSAKNETFECTVKYPQILQTHVKCITAFSTPGFELEAPAMFIPESKDCDEYGTSSPVRGHVALVRRGRCSFSQKATHAYAAGAVGLVLINSNDDMAFVLQVGRNTLSVWYFY